MSLVTLFYVYDPLCGWCYGFHPVIEKLAERFKDDIEFRVIAGGLAIGDNAQTISDGYTSVLQGLSQIETVTKVKFGRNFKLLAEEGSYFYSSETSCIAQTVLNELAPEKAIPFAGLLLNALFNDGKSLNEWDTIALLFEQLSIQSALAKEYFESEAIRRKTFASFEWCREKGASAFPALILKIGNETGSVSRGYRPFDTIESHLHHLVRNIKKI